MICQKFKVNLTKDDLRKIAKSFGTNLNKNTSQMSLN